MVVGMYRFTLKFYQSTGGGTSVNSDGHIIDLATSKKLVEIPCRFSSNSQGRFISSEDGSAKLYNFVISMPLGHPIIYRGQAIEIYDENVLLHKGTVELYMAGLMDAKAWI